MLKLIIPSSIIILLACNFDKKNEQTIHLQNSNNVISDTTNLEIRLTAKFNSFDTTIEVLFTDTKKTIGDKQKENFENFVLKQDLLTTEILQIIFDFYKRSYADYKTGWTLIGQISDEELEKHLPTPTTPENLKPYITPVIIHIQNEKECKDGTLGIEFDCTWDIENGLGVLIKDWKVVEASVAEISYF